LGLTTCLSRSKRELLSLTHRGAEGTSHLAYCSEDGRDAKLGALDGAIELDGGADQGADPVDHSSGDDERADDPAHAKEGPCQSVSTASGGPGLVPEPPHPCRPAPPRGLCTGACSLHGLAHPSGVLPDAAQLTAHLDQLRDDPAEGTSSPSGVLDLLGQSLAGGPRTRDGLDSSASLVEPSGGPSCIGAGCTQLGPKRSELFAARLQPIREPAQTSEGLAGREPERILE